MIIFDLQHSLLFVIIFISSWCTGYGIRRRVAPWEEYRLPRNDLQRYPRLHQLHVAQERQGVPEFTLPADTVAFQDHPQFIEDFSRPNEASDRQSVSTFQRIIKFFGYENESDPPLQQKKRKVRQRPPVSGHPFIPGHHLIFSIPQNEVTISKLRRPQHQVPVPVVTSGAASNLEPMIHNSLRHSLPPLSPATQLALARKLRAQLMPASFSNVFKSVVYDHYPPSNTEKEQMFNTMENTHPENVLRNQHHAIPKGHSSKNEVIVSSQAHLHKRDAALADSSTPKNFITPQPLSQEQISRLRKPSDLIIGSLMSFGESAAIVFPEPQPKIMRKKPARILSDVREAISFPSDPPPFEAVTRDFNKSMATGGDKCVLENGQAFHAGSCSLLLTQAACHENHWLVLRQDGTPICAHRKCPWGTLYYKGDCVDPADQSVCGVGQMLYVHFTGEAECDCDPKHYYDPSTDKCYAEHEQSFCKDSFYIELTADQKVECVPNPCHQDGFIKVDDRCYKKEYDGVCPTSQIMFVPETGSAECMQIIPHSIFGVGIQTACPSGSKRGFLGRCRSVFRMPTQRTFPKQKGICPSSFSGGVKHSCRRTIGLFG